MDIDSDPVAFLTEAASSAPDHLRPYFSDFADLYQRKLWYQLTVKVQEFLTLPESQPIQVALYQSFIAKFETKINPLRLVEIAVTVSQRYENPQDALTFLSHLADSLKPPPPPSDDDIVEEKVKKPSTSSVTKPPPSPEAYVLAKVSSAHAALVLGRSNEAKEWIKECEKILDGLDLVDTVVRAGFYRVAGDLYKWEAEYAQYYKTSLLYLACIPSLDALSATERVSRAHDLALAALLGESTYQFGELLQHPILESLGDGSTEQGVKWKWIKDLVEAFSKGDLGRFEALVPRFTDEPILQNSYPFLQQKVCLMALIEAVSKKPVMERSAVPFKTIAWETKITEEEVEHLVMKSLSLGLVKGSIDQVSRTVRVTWIQPRVLDKSQISGLKGQLEGWSERVRGVEARAAIAGQGITGVPNVVVAS